MSLDHFASPTRQVGDMSIVMPSGAKGWFESPRDGGAFAVGAGDWLVQWETSQSVQLADGATTLDASPQMPWFLNRRATNELDALGVRYQTLTSPGRIQSSAWTFVGSATPTNTRTTEWTSGSTPQSWRCGPSQRYLFCRRGSTLTLAVLWAPVSGASGYYLQSHTDTISGTVNLSTMLSTTGSLLVGRRYGSETTARHLAIAGLSMFTPAGGVTMADLGLDDDAGLVRLLVDPHGKLTEIASGLANRRSFDLCNSTGARKLVAGAVVSGDKLVCLHSGLTLTYQQDASPTAVCESREAYSPLSQKPEHRTSADSSPNLARIGAVVVEGVHYGNGNHGLENALERRSAATGYRIAPPILLPPVLHRETTATGDPVDGGAYYQMPTNISEAHQDLVVCHDAANGRLVVKAGYHSDSMANQPASGETTRDVGAVWVLRDGAAPKPLVIPFGAQTGSNRTASYGAMVAAGGKVYGTIRGRDTNNGRVRLVEVASDDTVAGEFVTAAPSVTDAGFPAGMVALSDGVLLAAYSVRTDPTLGYIGPALIAFDPADFGSSSQGMWGPRTGQAIAASKPSVPWHLPSLYPCWCPARDALDLYASSSTALVPAAWSFDHKALSANAIVTHVEGGVQFVGILTAEHDDPTRNDGAHEPEPHGSDREIGLKLHVFAWDSANHRLRPLRVVDLFPAKVRASNSLAGASSLPGNHDYNFTLSSALLVEGPRCLVGVYRSDSRDYSADVTGYRPGGLGVSLGIVDVQNWHRPTYTVDGVGPVVEASEFGAATLQARPMDGLAIELLLTAAGHAGSIGGGAQSSCVRRYVDLTDRLPPTLERDVLRHDTFAV